MKKSLAALYRDKIAIMLKDAGIVISRKEDIEIADFGLGEFEKQGLGLVVRINEPEYCSKWIVVFPGQTCPAHYHKLKKESFFVFKGTVNLKVNNKTFTLKPGDSYTVNQRQVHEFTSPDGAVVEEVSMHDENSDSYFINPKIIRDPQVED